MNPGRITDPRTLAGTAGYRSPPQPRSSLGLRVLRGLSGILAGGLVALAAVVGLAQWLVGEAGQPGPGSAAVTGHVVAALAAVVAQLMADRSRGPRAALAAGFVLVLTAGVLWFGWWT